MTKLFKIEKLTVNAELMKTRSWNAFQNEEEIIMPFVFARVSADDREFFESLNLRNCWGNAPFSLTKDTKWCIDRERNACLVRIGGGYQDMPNFHDFWWNGNTIRMEVISTSTGNYDDGLNIIWNITKLPIPEMIWDKRNQIIEMLYEAFSVDLGWCDECDVKSVGVNIMCTPEIVKWNCQEMCSQRIPKI